MTRSAEALLAALPMIMAAGCVPDIQVMKTNGSGGQSGASGGVGGAGGLRETNGGDTTLGRTPVLTGTGNEAGLGGDSAGDGGQPGQPRGDAGFVGADAGSAGAGNVLPWPPELLASEGYLLNDFDDIPQEGEGDECLDPMSRHKLPSENDLGFCSECFGDCNGSLGGQIETDLEDDPEKVFRGRGQSLRLDFDVSQTAAGCMTQVDGDPNHRYAGYIEALAGNPTCPAPGRGSFNVAALGLRALTLWLQAESDVVRTLELALKDTGTSPRQSYKRPLAPYVARASVSFNRWVKICVPLEDLSFANPERTEPVDFTGLGEINLTFNARLPGSRTGFLYVDEIAFERTDCND